MTDSRGAEGVLPTRVVIVGDEHGEIRAAFDVPGIRTSWIAVGPAGSDRQSDPAHEEFWTHALGAAESALGGVDVLINATAVESPSNPHRSRAENFDALVRTSLQRLFLGSRVFVPALAEGGCVVNVIPALAQEAHAPLHAAAAGTAITLTRGLAWEVGPRTRVNAVVAGDDPDARRAVARTARYLASPEASFLTGVCVEAGTAPHAGEVDIRRHAV